MHLCVRSSGNLLPLMTRLPSDAQRCARLCPQTPNASLSSAARFTLALTRRESALPRSLVRQVAKVVAACAHADARSQL